jgi:pyroglutamyl-peptidase
MAARGEATNSLRPLRFLVGGLAVFCLSALVTWAVLPLFADAAAGPAQQPAARDTTKAPVILLTGFEPFGKKKLPNPSWEGIKRLDGQQWKGYRLVCKQVPVVWGAPLEHLPGWISEYQPVAIFAFGQGGTGYFAVESRAANARAAKVKDNRGERRPMPTILEGAADVFDASIQCAMFVSVLSEKGYRTRLSTRAGRYLCEEMLYSLEYLKATKKLPGTVMFCHVPSLDTYVPLNQSAIEYLQRWIVATALFAPVLPFDPAARYQRITPEYVQSFVKDVLETWRTLYRGETPAAPAVRSARGKEDGRQQDIKDIKEFINRYFSTWSKQDMKGYDACFLPDAVIQHIDAKGRITTTPRVQFIASQRNYHRNSPVRTIEVPESIDVRFEKTLARVVVFWRLTAGSKRVETGYDHFTLMRHEGQWRIVNLVFYSSAEDGKIN